MTSNTTERAAAERAIALGEDSFSYRGRIVTIKDDSKGWTYACNGIESRNLDDMLSTIGDGGSA
jgi:hypothetical protein